jgi:signal transduction histidine kinase
VIVRNSDGRLLVEVADDGVGGANQRCGDSATRRGAGGDLQVETAAGAETTLRARLPC